ncbi:phosphatidylinositol-specific phospholipase C domain-containing protein [Pararobbsia silviterrae]|uniref:1-phosphatidylinositol phosphodiesterase n=1 Tax=Pararobbsia silviterrae TaxID=1792498 RepID=A0A494X5M7_9BURK|nr:phosphatidylinositol-specific phospholipase C domain-containing protein [Pararobbsia silviterrae]RKP43546.1 phosphatidylinositol-specific phospholipase C domain-containing protein [Pararobbsia silviterrae]
MTKILATPHFNPRRRLCLRAVATGTLGAAGALVAPSTFAYPGRPHDEQAYYTGQMAQADYSNWMSKFSPSKRLIDMSIPGTHDTMATVSEYGHAAQCQTMSLAQQLKAGIRFFDFRVGIARAPSFPANDLSFWHGPAQFATCLGRDAMPTIRKFLDDNPSEAVFIRLKKERSDDDNKEVNDRCRNILFGSNSSYMYHYPGRRISDVRMEHVRGQIVIFRDLAEDADTYGFKYGSDPDDTRRFGIAIQDNYALKTNWDLYWKWQRVREFLGWSIGGPARTNQLYINFISAGTGSYPYFVASGYDSMNGNALTTGLLTVTDKYPDFKKSGGFWYFTGTNILTYEALNGLGHVGEAFPQLKTMKNFGVIMMDFPATGLIKSIIDHQDVA